MVVEYEIVDGSEPERRDPVPKPGDLERGRRWWLLLIPGLLIALVVGALTRDASPAADEAADSVPATEEVPAYVVDDPQPIDRLLASFYDRRLLSGSLDGPVVASSLDGEHKVDLPLTGAPLAEADGWLVLLQNDQIVVVDLREVVPEPILLWELGGRSAHLSAQLVRDTLMLESWSEFSDGSELRRFDVVTWDQIDTPPPLGIALRSERLSIPGNGLFSGESDGFERHSDGSIVAADRARSLVRECSGWNECNLTLCSNEGWEKLETLPPDLDVGWFGYLVPDSQMVLGVGDGDEAQIVDISTGSVLRLVSDRYLQYSVPIELSETGLLLWAEDHLMIADTETGETFEMHRPARSERYSAFPVIVDVDWELVKVWIDPSQYPIEAEAWDRLDEPEKPGNGEAESPPSPRDLLDQILVEPIEGDGFAMGLEPGSVVGLGDVYVNDRPESVLVDLSDGSGVRLGAFELMAVLDDYAVGVPRSTVDRANGLVIYDRRTEELSVVYPELSFVEAGPGLAPNTVWTVTMEDSLTVVRLLDLANSAAELARFETVDTVRLYGYHGSNPLVVGDASGVFRLSENGAEPLGPGTVLARTDEFSVRGLCDDGLRCQAQIVGGRTGQFDLDSSILVSRRWLPPGAIEGNRLMISGDDSKWHVFDLDSGEEIDARFGSVWDGVVKVGSDLVYAGDSGRLKLLDETGGGPAAANAISYVGGLVAGPPAGG